MPEFQRPEIPYTPVDILPNYDRYTLESESGQPLSSDDLEGDFNYIIDSMNAMYVELLGIAAGIIPGSDNMVNINKFPITDGNGNITWSKVIAAYLAANCVTTPAIQNGSITRAKLAAASVDYTKILADTITQDNMDEDSVGTPQLIDNSVTNDKIAANAVTATEIAANTITAAEIANQTITAAQIADDTLTAAQIANNSITAAKIADQTLTAAQMANNTITALQLAAVLQLPVGIMLAFAGTSVAAIPGWLFCLGQPVLRATYVALYAAIGTTYGAGDGVTTFNLPDARGRSIIGIDMNAANTGAATNNRVTTATMSALTVGGNGGEEQHTITTPEIPAHSHTVVRSTGTGQDIAGSSVYIGAQQTTVGPINTSSSGGGLPHNNIQPSIFTQMIIYTGVL